MAGSVTKEYHVVVKTDLQNEIPIGFWTVDRGVVDQWIANWLPGGEDYERFSGDGEQVTYVKIMVRAWVRPDWMDNVNEGEEQ